MDNTFDNKHRHTKKEDPLSPDYTNPPAGGNQQANETEGALAGNMHNRPLPLVD